MDELAKLFEEYSSTFRDTSNLGKMKDSYPLDLFTLKRAFKLEQIGNADQFMYIFIFGLWMEAIENPDFNLGTRLVIIETLLLFFVTLGKVLEHSQMPKKKGQDADCIVTFVSEGKIKRFACTLAAQHTALMSGGENLGLDRIGSHTEENYIGNIRRICRGDNRASFVKKQVSRFELSRHLISCMPLEKPIAKRANLGGVRLGHDSSKFCYATGTPNDFAWELLLRTGLHEDEVRAAGNGMLKATYNECDFVGQTRQLTKEAPLSDAFVNVRKSTQGSNIMSRIHTFGGSKKDVKVERVPVVGDAVIGSGIEYKKTMEPDWKAYFQGIAWYEEK
jgi:hypothetical protein